MKVLAYDVVPDKSFAPSPHFRYGTLNEVLTQSDVISLHCPAMPDGKPLIDAAALAKMKTVRTIWPRLLPTPSTSIA